jgi:hypothetical protein
MPGVNYRNATISPQHDGNQRRGDDVGGIHDQKRHCRPTIPFFNRYKRSAMLASDKTS